MIRRTPAETARSHPFETRRIALLEIEKIQQLVEMMTANDLVELSLKDGEVEVNLRRPDPHAGACAGTHAPAPHVPARPPMPGSSNPAELFVSGEVAAVDLVEIRSPMVGTFYAGPDPNSPPFVQVGANVGPSTVVCILEAMKVFSEIKAETSGTIERILAQDGQAVEYGQALFLVRPQ